jgi:hypothetical protein
MRRKNHSSALTMLACLCLWAIAASAQSNPKDEPNLTDEQKKEFLLNAKVIVSKQSGKGITHP